MSETIHFRSETIAWWSTLLATGRAIGRVHRWDAISHGPPNGGAANFEQHATATMVLCLVGVSRLEDECTRLDLARGDAVVISPGAWHRHAPLRPGSVTYRQGVIAGRSDFFLESSNLLMIASWPEEPARRYLREIDLEADEERRRSMLAALIMHLSNETARPLPTHGSIAMAMEVALRRNLHRGDVVQRIVEASGRSRAQAYRLFQAHWGVGISSAVRHARLELAHELLLRGLPVIEVAARVGIHERSVFTRAYRRYWKEAPSETCA